MTKSTVSSDNPDELIEEETIVMSQLCYSFTLCEKLQSHLKFLYKKGSLYKIFNGNLLYHGCMLLDSDGTFLKAFVYGKEFSGKALYDELERWEWKG